MPTPTPRPVPPPVDESYLRRAAEEATRRWVEDTERALPARWDGPQVLLQAFGNIATDDRRVWWREQVRAYAREHTHRFREAGRAALHALADQTYARLRDATPRPTERELSRRTPEILRMLADTVGSTAIGRELTALALEIDAAAVERAVRSSVLDDLRTARLAELGHITPALSAPLARIDEIEAEVRSSLSLRNTLLPLLAADFAARDAARRTMNGGHRAADESDRALRASMGAGLEEQHQAMAAPLAAARSSAVATVADMPRLTAAIEGNIRAFKDRFVKWDLVGHPIFEQAVHTYGAPAVRALLTLSLDTTVSLFRLMSRNVGIWPAFLACWPAGTSEAELAWAFAKLMDVPDAAAFLADIRKRKADKPGYVAGPGTWP
ncbi:hypothetical protein [Yinghuangia soli]|uniref:Uncharacterized protein n=1 Tax=Yinghuangia soli TaxID=2908204 RepID=A0AA41Q270_9ACTN|nr:hypothetical protein [Yinghuangia soli]MCF2529837.1 hypothetical protein [Yinghuangia soli]